MRQTQRTGVSLILDLDVLGGIKGRRTNHKELHIAVPCIFLPLFNKDHITFGKEKVMHGFDSLVLLDEKGEPSLTYSIASGLDYPSVGPEHAFLHEKGRVSYETVSDEEALDAFFELSRLEGIIPAIESSHALAYAIRLAKAGEKGNIIVNLSGRGDKDAEYLIAHYGEKYGIKR